MGIEWGAARLAWDMVQTVILAAVAVYVWWQHRTRATVQAIQSVNERVTDLAGRVDRIDHELQHQPGYDEIHHMHEQLQETNQRLSEVSAQLKGTTRLLDRVHSYLLHQGKESR